MITALRDSLTLLAILLIGVLTAALVGPYVIDWDSHRALIARKLSEAAGTPVTVSGSIDLKLLPKPVFRVGGVVVGDGKAEGPRLSAASLDAELSLTALMRGQFQVVDTVLTRPRLDLVQAPDGSFGLGPFSDAAADRVAVDHLGLRDGTIALTLADGREATLTGLDLDGEAASLRGPFKATGRMGSLPFRIATGAIDHGRLRVKLHLDGASLRPSLDLDGLAAADGTAARPAGRKAAAGPGFDGSVTATGGLPLDGTPATVPWRMTAHLSADAASAAASDVELRAGTDLRALIAGGTGRATYAAGAALPAATIELHGAALDVDALAVAPETGSIAPPAGLDLLRLLLRLGGDGAGTVSLPVRLDIAAGFDTATLAGQTLLGTSLKLGLGPEPTAALKLTVAGPQGASLSLDGRLDPGPARPVAGPFGAAPPSGSAMFRGRAEARSNDLKRTAAWLRPAAPDLAAWLAVVPGRSVAAAGDVDASAIGIAARDVDLHLDGSTFAGALSLTRAVGPERARLFADLTSEALDLDRLPDLSGAVAASHDLDLDLSLAASAVTVVDPTPDLGSSRLGPLAAGHLALRLTRNGDALKLDRLSLDLDGAGVSATASRVGRDARADVHLSAPQLGPIADALAGLLPSPAVTALRARAAALSPVDAALRVEATASTDDGPLAPTRVSLTGTTGGTRVDAALVPDTAGTTADAATRPVALSLRLDAPEADDLLRQFGLPTTPSGLGSAHVEGQAKGTLSQGFAADLRATLGSTTLAYAGRAGPVGGAGRITLRTGDLHPLLAAVGVDGPADIPADVATDVSWDDARLDGRRIAGRVGGTSVAGDLSLDLWGQGPSGAAPALRGRLSLDAIPAEVLLALALGPAAPATDAPWSKARFAPPSAVLPRSEVALTIGRLPLRGRLQGTSVSLMLRTGGGGVTLADIAGRLDTGSFGGALTARRDGTAAAVSGRATWADITLNGDGLSGRTSGAQDFAGTGDSPAALMASLGGTGTLTLKNAALARMDPAAPARIGAAVAARDAAAERGGGAEPTPPDPEAIRRDLASGLDRGPLNIGDAATATVLTGGILRTGPLKASGATLPAPTPTADRPVAWSAESVATLDLGALTLATRTVLRAFGDGDVTVARVGPLGGEARTTIDASGLVGAVQAAAIARAQDRIDVMEQDIRERAFFNRRLKAIQADQQAARDAAEADRQAAVARAVAEAQARADAVAKAAAEAQKAAAEARAAADARRVEAARQKAETTRLQADMQAAAARADAVAKEEAEKQRFIDRALKSLDPPPDLRTRDAPLLPPRRPAVRSTTPDNDPFDAPPPPSIIQERSAAPARDPFADR